VPARYRPPPRRTGAVRHCVSVTRRDPCTSGASSRARCMVESAPAPRAPPTPPLPLRPLHPGALTAGHELRRHLAAGLVDHLVAEHDRPTPVVLGGGAVRLEDVVGAVELLLCGRIHLVDDLH